MNDAPPAQSAPAADVIPAQPLPGLPARRKLDHLAWALGALALGWLAQNLFASQRLLEGLVLYAVAIPLFAVQISRGGAAREKAASGPDAPFEREYSLSRRPWQAKLRVAPGIRGWVGLGLALAGLILSFASLSLFTFETQNRIAWSWYVVSLAFFGAGIWLAEPRISHQGTSNGGQASPRPLIISSALSLLWGALLLALFFRLFHFFSLPFGTWFDEAVAGIQARRILGDPSFRPVFWEPINLPAHLLYLFSFSFRLFGVSTPALRVVPVLFGVGGVLFAYLFGREWKGPGWGLLLAFLVATMRWHVNFSRIAMTGIDAPFFEFASLYFGLRALRTGRMQPIVWAGLCLGFGLSFYGAFRLFVGALLLFVLVRRLGSRGRGVPARQDWLPAGEQGRPSSRSGETGQISDRQSGSGRQVGLRLGLLVVAAWLAMMPVAQFAARHPDIFWWRTRTVSIFESRDEPNLGRALLGNARKHLLMFNYQGDVNGRHNLPGAPTLDRLSGVLFALGLGLAIARRDAGSTFFLLLWPIGLAGGILTLDFEAPQSLRSIAALPAVAYFIALSLEALWLELRWAARIKRPRYSLIPVVAGLGFIAVSNGAMYFERQAGDFAVWRAFSTAETLVGKRMAQLGDEPVYFLSPFFLDQPSIRFHAPAEESTADLRKVMLLPDALPAREPAGRPVVYFIHPDEAWVFDLGRQVYLTGSFETLPSDSERPPVVYVLQLEPQDVASVQGLDFRYWAGDDWEGEGIPVASGRSPVIDTSWPDPVSPQPPFVAEWNGVLYAPEYGYYALSVETPGRVTLTLDGEVSQGVGQLSVGAWLAQGNHGLRLHVAGGEGRVRLAWQLPTGEAGTIPQWALYRFPVSGHGLLGRYYADPAWQGEPALERIDPVLNVYFHLTPLPRPYSVEWTGVLDVPYGGVYALGLQSVNEARLFLDGQPVIEATVPDQYVEEYVTLPAGLHDLRITYQDWTDRSQIHLYWTRPGGEKEIIPTQYLWPSRAAKSIQDYAPQAETPPVGATLGPMELVWLATWGTPGDGEGQFWEPRDVAVLDDTVFVADTGNRRVQALSRDGAFRTAWSGGQEPFEEPLALGVDSQGRLLVLDSLPGWIYRFDAEGTPLDRVAGPSSQTFHPRGLTVLEDDTLVVTDTGGARLVFFDSAGNMAGRLGALGSGPGQLSDPVDVAADGLDTYYVAEARSQRIQRLDRRGNNLSEWPIPPSVAFDGPHLAWAPDGSLLVTAPDDGAILRYTPDGQLLTRWTQAGGLQLRQPVGIYVDAASGTLFVTDTATHQVHVLRIALSSE